MRTRWFLCCLAFLLTTLLPARAQLVLDCACLAQQPGMTVTNCVATIPDICAVVTNCIRSTVQPPPPIQIIQCGQNPAVGTPVGPGTHIITVNILIAGLAPLQCSVPFTVVAPITGPFGLQCAPNKTVNCDANWSFDPPTVQNPCCPNAALPNGGAAISVVNDVTNGVCPMVITRTWKATDQCGQSATCSQTVTVVDNVPPTLNCGPNQTINCGTPWNFSTPTYSDNCTAASDMVLSIVSTVTNGVCPRVATRVWQVTDLCGNTATCTETVTIVDNVPPTISCGPNQTVNCGQQWNFSTPVISDNCTPVAGLILNILSTTTNGACPEVVTRIWEVVDRCGNKATCTETVTIQDITPPTITCAPNKQVPCGAQWSFDPPTATDNCGVGVNGTPSVTIAIVNTVTNSLCPLTVIRTWSATDACGNISQCSQTVTVTGGPTSLTLNCAALAASPELQTNACTGYVPALCPQAVALAQQLCPCPINCTQSPAAGTPYPPGTYPITVTISDGAGGSATCTVNFVVTAPPGGCTTNPCPPTLTAVLNTGTTNGNGGLLPTGAQEQVWVNISAPGGPIPMVMFDTNLYPVFSGPWVPASATSAWVSPDVSGIGPVGLYTNRIVYDAKCDRVCLKGRIASDDDGYLYVNGVLISGAGFTAWSNINHCADFKKGPNVIEFVVNNGSQWTGFRTELEFYEECCCNTFTNVWNTGMDGTNALAVGQPDPNYVLVSAPAGCAGPAQVVGGIPGPWVPNGPNSQWIGGGPNADCDAGVYHYRITFDLPCVDGASVMGQWTADDFGAVLLNGQLLYSIPNNQNPFSFTGWHPLALTNGFVCGTNTLDFYVTNWHGVVNPTGFRAELTNVWDDCCCGPLEAGTNYHSGVNAGIIQPQNWPDPQLVLSCAPAGVPTGPVVVTNPNPFWMPNGPDSAWLAPVGNPNLPGGLYCYNYRFTLPPCTNGTPKYAVKGQWMGDDAGTIHVNGIPTGNNLPNGWAFTNWHPISITSGLVPGINFLTLFVTNASFGDTGIRIELTNYATCCDCVMTNCNVTINCSTNLDIEACALVGNQAVVTYPLPAASSTCGSIASVVCTPPSGSPFPLGITTVNCIATDVNGNSASCSFNIRVRRDITPPNCPPFNMTVTGCPPRMPNFSTNALITDNCSTLAQMTISQNIPPGTPLPAGTTVVILNLCDAAGNCRVCDVVINAVPSGNPPVIKCPQDQIFLTCSNTAKGFFKATATGNNGPIVCVPPSGSNFPIGTNIVTCTATNNCGWSVSCSFKVIVKPYSFPGPFWKWPSATYWAGKPDNCVQPQDPANTVACITQTFPSFVPWKNFDAAQNNAHVGHRFAGLPANILKAVLTITMEPTGDTFANNDTLRIGINNPCNAGVYTWVAPISTLAGAGGTWKKPNNKKTTFTLDLATLNPAFIAKLNTDGYLDVVVEDDSIVDYMQLRIWRCPPPYIGIGVPHSTGLGTNPPSTLAAMAQKVLPGFGPIGVGPAICVLPPTSSPNKVSEVEVDLGGGDTYSFTTILDMEAEDGATLEIVDPLDPMGVPLLTATLSRGTKCYDLKKCKGGRSDSVGFRTTAVNDNGDLLGSFFQTLNEGDTNAALILRPEDGVTAFPVTFTIHRGDGTISVTYPGSSSARGGGRKGWDGTIKGRPPEAARKGWDGTIKGRPPEASMITFTPSAPHPVVAPQLLIYGTGMDEWLLSSEVVGTMNDVYVKKLTSALGFASPEDEQTAEAWAAWHQSTAANDGVSVVSIGDGGGVSLDVGHSSAIVSRNILKSFFETGDKPTQVQFRGIGGPWVLTNRPPPPVFDTRFIGTSNNVFAAVDFSGLEATAIRVELWSNGTLIASGANPGPVITPADEFAIGGMPNRISMNLTVERSLRLFNDELFSVQGDDGSGAIIAVQGDELRFTPEIPASVEVPLYLTTLQYSGSEGTEALLYDLQRTPYCGDTPPSLSIRKNGAIITADYNYKESVRLQASEDLNGPWFELGVQPPYLVNPTNTAAKFFRLICE